MRRGALLGWVITLCCAAVVFGEEPIAFEVSAGDVSRDGSIVTWPLPASLADAKHVELRRADTGEPIDCQIDRDASPPRLVFILDQALDAGQSRTYRAEAVDQPPVIDQFKGQVNVEAERDAITVDVNGRKVLVYNIATLLSPVEGKPFYRMSGHVHPLHAPGGKIVTDDFPPDHAHHHGMMFAWTKTTFEGRAVDFWNQAKLQGTVKHAKMIATRSGPVFGQFTVERRHVNLNAPAGPTDVLREIWRVRVYNIEAPFIVDVRSTQHALRKPLIVNKYHYGGFALRMARQWMRTDPSIVTRLGDGREAGNHTRPGWVDYQGPIDDQIVGVTLMDHPDNFRHPQPVRIHPKHPYMCFMPGVLGRFEIQPGKPYTSQYRLIIRNTARDTETINHHWADWSNPPATQTGS